MHLHVSHASDECTVSQVLAAADTFAAWRARWDAESAMSEAKLEAEAALQAAGPTGKQWFLQQEATGAADEEAAEVLMPRLKACLPVTMFVIAVIHIITEHEPGHCEHQGSVCLCHACTHACTQCA